MATKPRPGGLNLGSAPPPPVSTGKKNDFDRFIGAHPGLKGLKTTIQQWAGEYGVPAVSLAAVIWKESKGKNNPWNPAVQGTGVAQLNIDPRNHSNAPAAATAALGRAPTYADATNPSTSIQILAYTMAQAQAQGYTDVDSFYQHVWNPKFKPTKTNPLPSAYLKGYNVTVSGNTPQQKAAGSVATSNAKKVITDPWVIVTSKGGLKTVYSANAPKNVLRNPWGDAMTLSTFTQERNALDALYLPYTGRTASDKAVAAYIRNPVSTPELTQRLANPKNNPNIFKSPIWQTHAADYEAVYKNIYGNDAKPPRAVILAALVHNLSQTGFEEQLRSRPDYNTSEEYKANAAQFRSGYEGIYGTPDATGEHNIDTAVRKGWNGDQWMQFLRDQPEYTSSGEFQKNIYSLFSRLGFEPGVTAPFNSQGQQVAINTPLGSPSGATP